MEVKIDADELCELRKENDKLKHRLQLNGLYVGTFEQIQAIKKENEELMAETSSLKERLYNTGAIALGLIMKDKS